MASTSHKPVPDRCATCQARASCLFAESPPKAMSQFQMITQVRRYPRGDIIFRQGEHAHGLFILRSGWAKLFHLTPAGKAVTLGLIGPGRILGLTEIVTGSPYLVSAETLDESDVEYIEKQRFLIFLLENPRLAVEPLTTVSQEARKFLTQLCEMAGKLPTVQRLLHTLQDLAKTCGHKTDDGIRLKLPFTVQDLADSIGCSRQWASKLVNELEDQGLIKRKEGGLS
jgi:CRP/FNR family transcriptional regulator